MLSFAESLPLVLVAALGRPLTTGLAEGMTATDRGNELDSGSRLKPVSFLKQMPDSYKV